MSEMTERQMESAALSTLQRGLEKYAIAENISYEEALMRFSCSETYKELFDYSSLLWTQGPDYLLSVYEGEMKR